MKRLQNGPIAQLPDNSYVKATYEGILELHPALTQAAKKVLVYPQVTNESLLSVSQLTKDQCQVFFNETRAIVTKANKIILTGSKNPHDNLYDIILPNDHNNKINFIIRKDKTKTELAKFYHATVFSPPVSTLQKAIRKGNFLSWPGISNLNFNKLIGTTEATEMGHLDQERKGLQSTKHVAHPPQNDDDNFPQHQLSKTYAQFTAIINPTPSKAYMDLTGKFPYTSSRRNKYLVVVYDYDSNAIVFEAIKSRQSKEILEAFKKCETKIATNTNKPDLYVLDNEASNDLKNSLVHNNQSFELVPPNIHRRNAAEKAICTMKNHILSGLANCDKSFPILEWDRLLIQAEITLNLLRNSRVNPHLSSWAYIQKPYDFNKMPMAPPGTKIVAHSKPQKRASWAYHGQSGWYIGPAPEHYRCVKCYIPATHREIVTDTIKFIPTNIPIPEASIDDHIRNSLEELTGLLANKVKTFPPILSSPTSRQAIIQLAKIFQRDKHDTEHSTSEGASKKEQTTKPKKMSDEEFEELLRSIKPSKKTTNQSKPEPIMDQKTKESKCKCCSQKEKGCKSPW